jgi:Flp pilus assembly pilin Flp
MRFHSLFASNARADLRVAADLVLRGAVSRGQGLVEYVLIILFVALAVALAVSLLGPTISSIFAAIPPAL